MTGVEAFDNLRSKIMHKPQISADAGALCGKNKFRTPYINQSCKNQTRSANRVRDLAEVFTAGSEVKKMLDLVQPLSLKIDSRILEPSCGNGNFIVAIAERKLSRAAASCPKWQDFEAAVVCGLGSIYGIDICSLNVSECRERLFTAAMEVYYTKKSTITPSTEFIRAIRYIIETNIVLGDALNGQSAIYFNEYRRIGKLRFEIRKYNFRDILNNGPGQADIISKKILNYVQIGS